MNDNPERIDINPISHNLDKIPEILYKYRYFDGKDYGMKLATHGEAYFASGKEFNDPFECYFVPESKLIDYEGEELRKYLRMKALQQNPNASEKEIADLIKAGMDQHRKLKVGDPTAMDSVMEVQYKNFGILSLSADPYSIPMWAYYADSFKGFCVGLSTIKLAEHQDRMTINNEFLMLYGVDYKDEIIRYNIDVNPDGISDEELEETAALYYTKSKCWKHESEYRLICDNYVSKRYSFGTDAVAEIIVGMRVCDKDYEKLLEQLRLSKSKAKVKRLLRSHTKFSLEYEDVNI